MCDLKNKYLFLCFGAVMCAIGISACGGGSSGTSTSTAAPTETTTSPNAGNTASTEIDPATGSVAAAEVTCQGACVSITADSGNSTE